MANEDMFQPDVAENKNDGRWVRITWDTQNESQKRELNSLIKALQPNGSTTDIKRRLGKFATLVTSGKVQIVQKK